MPKHYLVFINGAWHRTNRLPTAKVAPPEPHQIKWLLDGWSGEYCICERRRLWRMPHVNGQGRRKGWKEVLLIERTEGYKGANLWRDGVRHYYCVNKLRRLLRRNPTFGVMAGSTSEQPEMK